MSRFQPAPPVAGGADHPPGPDHTVFYQESLAPFDGQGGRPCYLACNGLVYDVTNSFLWQAGHHQVSHRAGCDLTAALDRAPHGVDLLRRFPIVGTLQEEPSFPD